MTEQQDAMKGGMKPAGHNHRSISLKEYFYSQPGTYFVTLVTQGYKCIFRKITSSKMQYYDMGRIAKECWLLIPEHFTKVEINPYVIMPNHIHGIITIHDDSCRSTIYRVPTIADVNDLDDLNKLHTQNKRVEHFGRIISSSLPTTIPSYKAAVY